MKLKSVRIAKKTAICGVVCLSLTGCAETIIAGLTISEILTAGSIGSALLTGKGLGEHALDLVTGQDCRILEAVFRKDRAICEPKDSVATKDDFKGLVALLDSPAGQDIQLAEIPNGKDQFPKVDPVAKANSGRVLAALTRKSVVISERPVTYKIAYKPRLTKETASFDPSIIKRPEAKTIAATDLKKRLLGGTVY